MSIHTASAAHHTGSARTYTLILGALLVLTAITVTASGIDFGSPSINVVIALIIASIKGSLVALFFMHLKDDKPLNGIIFLTGLVWLSVFLIFCYVDADTRPTVIPQTLKVPAQGSAPAPRPAAETPSH